MKSVFTKTTVFCLMLIFSSCSNEDETIVAEEDFFNLSIGNEWVYKKYENTHNNPSVLSFNGGMETVKVLSNEMYQGFSITKLSVEKVNINNSNSPQVTYNYVRVNSAGHLVDITGIVEAENTLTETDGMVLHPGEDHELIYTKDLQLGSIEHQLQEPTSIIVEGTNYLIHPFIGVFTPSPDYPDLTSKTIEENYAKNIGLVKQVCHAVSSNYSWEMRLVSYIVN